MAKHLPRNERYDPENERDGIGWEQQEADGLGINHRGERDRRPRMRH